ncbi:50S ribosomal protein L21 [Sphingomonas sp.]|uniref:50S ribosomal protein L21 n=1 Tax=Sphingomonas sp. TaxID=28214 RepID=UPI00389E6D63
MFAVVRTGGKQYRVALGDKIVVEKLDGSAGDRVTLGDVLLAGDGGSLKSTDGLTVAAEIVAQAKADKVTVFKKRRRHNYRRKKGHRQQHTILKIVAIGDQKEQKKAAPKAAAAPKSEAPKAAAGKPAAARAKETADATADQQEANAIVGTPTENPAPNNENAAGAEKPAAKKAAPAKPKAGTQSTKNAAPAKGGAKKTPKAK